MHILFINNITTKSKTIDFIHNHTYIRLYAKYYKKNTIFKYVKLQKYNSYLIYTQTKVQYCYEFFLRRAKAVAKFCLRIFTFHKYANANM